MLRAMNNLAVGRKRERQFIKHAARLPPPWSPGHQGRRQIARGGDEDRALALGEVAAGAKPFSNGNSADGAIPAASAGPGARH